LIDRFVPDPSQATTLIVRETIGSQHFFRNAKSRGVRFQAGRRVQDSMD